jgi:hypothetical protein
VDYNTKEFYTLNGSALRYKVLYIYSKIVDTLFLLIYLRLQISLTEEKLLLLKYNFCNKR